MTKTTSLKSNRNNRGRFVKGHKQSPKSRLKMSIAKKGKPVNPKGSKFSKKHKKNLSLSHLGKNTGPKHFKWRGDKAGYMALHARLSRRRGKPKYCENCDLKDPRKRYEWANLNGKFADINDYKRMCVPCHRKFDLGGK